MRKKPTRKLRIAVFSRFAKQPIYKLLHETGIKHVETLPDIVLCWGGDGTLLLGEAKYPGVPKILVRRSKVGNKAHNIPFDQLVNFLIRCEQSGFSTHKEMKMEISVNGRGRKTTLIALNDCTIRNKTQLHALRCSVLVGGKAVAKEVIGDGVVIATPFGSTAYFQSIARQTFPKGMGIAFNNSFTPIPALLVDERSRIAVRIDRGDALVSVDNVKMITARPGSRIVVRRAKEPANIIDIK